MFSNLNIGKTKKDFVYKIIIKPILEFNVKYKLIQNIEKFDENTITKLLVKYLKEEHNFSDLLLRGHIRLIYQEVKVGQQNNTQPDLSFIRISLFGNYEIVAECKRLYNSGSIQEYCGENGLKRFESGYYQFNKFIGMVGYIQNNKEQYINKIIKKIGNIFLNKKYCKNCYLTKHKFQGKRCLCFHVFMTLN